MRVHRLVWFFTVPAAAASDGSTTVSPTSGSSSEDGGGGGSSVIPMVAGAVVGLLAIIAIVAVTLYCIKGKTYNNVYHTSIEKILPSDASETNGHSVTDIENPALTANPDRNTLTLLPLKTGINEVAQIRK